MSGKFCPKCGRTDADFYEGFCINCYVDTNMFMTLPEEIEITQCKRCNSWFFRDEWIEDSFLNLKKIIASKLKTNLNSPNVEVSTEGNFTIVSVSGFIDKNHHYQITREFRVKTGFHDITCDRCRKMSGKYFEYKIQLRHAKEKNEERFRTVEKFIKNEVSYLAEKMPAAKAFWFEENKDGVDFFFGFKAAGDAVLKPLGNRFRIKFERSSRINGIDKANGKIRYRITFCARV